MQIRRRGFTLIELLVVVAIIAVLIAILLPALGRAKANGIRVKCAAVLKQWSTAIHMYAQEQYDMFGVQWQEAGGGSKHVWTSISPNSTTEIYDAEWTSGGNGWRMSGGLHSCPGDPAYGQILNNPNLQTTAFRPPCDYTMVTYIVPGNNQSPGSNAMWKINDFNHPSTTLLMCDDSPDHTAGSFSIQLMGDFNSGITGTKQTFAQALDLRHMGLGNALFLDGHVDTAKLQDFINNVAATTSDYSHLWTFKNVP